MNCPECGGQNVHQRAPAPGEGGLFRLRCRDCGHEVSGIADPAAPWEGTDVGSDQPEPPLVDEAPIAAPCSVCGRPGRVQNLPGGVPVSDSLCDEHVPAHTLKPLSCVWGLLALALIAWLAFRWLAG